MERGTEVSFIFVYRLQTIKFRTVQRLVYKSQTATLSNLINVAILIGAIITMTITRGTRTIRFGYHAQQVITFFDDNSLCIIQKICANFYQDYLCFLN